MIYEESRLVRVARRENNPKRTFLVVNLLQGKHLPAPPSETLCLFEALARQVKEAFPGERLLVVGFAETATAIGASLASALGCSYIQTTREKMDGCNFLHFTEAHSHATEQKLVGNDLGSLLSQIDRIVFAEDELTTGNTILSLVKVLEKSFDMQVRYAAACLLSGVSGKFSEAFAQKGISLLPLLTIDQSDYTQKALCYRGDGSAFHLPTPVDISADQQVSYAGRLDPKRIVSGKAYHAACDRLWQQVQADFSVSKGEKVLVLGTEEFMYPALWIAYQMEQQGADVKFHATTRSPIVVSSEETYPFHNRYTLKSLYESCRTTFLYELCAYEKAFIVTDAPVQQTEGLLTLLTALRHAGVRTIHTIRWCDC